MVTPNWVRTKNYTVKRLNNGSATVKPGPSSQARSEVRVPANKAGNISAFLREHFRSSINRRKEIQVPFELNCNAPKHMYHNSTNNGRTGHVLTKASSTRRLGTEYNSTLGLKRIRKGITVLGHGKQGVVYLGCLDNQCDKKVIIKVSPFDKSFPQNKQPADFEFKIHRQIFKLVPQHVTAMYSMKHCREFAPTTAFSTQKPTNFDYSHQTVTFGEYLPGGELDRWLDKVQNRITDDDLARMIAQILRTLKKIQVRYPEFRHNDLHLQNILVDDTRDEPRLAISDFGIARITKRNSNPLVNTRAFGSAGISSSTNVKYDQHFFLNSMRHHLRSWTGIPRTKAFLEEALPAPYRNRETNHVKNWRLMNRTDTRGLPSIDALLAMPYIANARRSPSLSRSVSSPRNTVRLHRYSPSSPNEPSPSPLGARGGAINAADLARNMLAGNSSVSVSVQRSARPSAAEYLRMSPASRARFRTTGRVTTKRPPLLTFPTTRRTPTRVVQNVARRSPTRVTRAMMRNARFNRAVVAGATRPGNNRPFENRWNASRKNVLTRMENRIRQGLSPFSQPRSAAAASPPRVTRKSPTKLLQAFMRAQNATKVKTPNLKSYLKTKGFSTASANREVDPWKAAWNASRRNANVATGALKAGRNLKRNGFNKEAIRIATRRVKLGLVKSPGGRIRAKKRLLTGMTKAELLAMNRNVLGSKAQTIKMLKNQGMPANVIRQIVGSVRNNRTKANIVRQLYG